MNPYSCSKDCQTYLLLFKWFPGIHPEEMSLEDPPKQQRSKDFDDETLNPLIVTKQIIRELAKTLDTS